MCDCGRTPTCVVEHGVIIPPEVRYTGELERGLVVVNNLRRRGRRLGADIFARARRVVPLDLVGMGWEEAGGIGEIRHHELPAFMARYRFFFNPIRYTSLGLSVCEAMMIGILREDPQRIERYFGEARTIARDLGIELRLPRTQPRPHPLGTPGPERCDWPWHGPYISYQGLAMPCCMIATPDRLNFGSMAERGVEAIWNGPEYESFRLRLASDEPPEICTSCSVYTRTF
jgi:hypothetical protein